MKPKPFNKNSLLRNKKGSFALEYAIILPLFIFLLFTIIEYGLITYANAIINNAVMESSRYGITGDNYQELQGVTGTNNPIKNRQQFIESIVDKRLGFFKNFGEAHVTAENRGKLDTISSNGITGYGGANDLVMYKVNFTWNVITPFMYMFIGKNGKYTITARTINKNEDF